MFTLAGGESSRMGKDKALLRLDGKPFIQHITEVLSEVFEQVVIVSDHGDRYKCLGLPIYEDVFKNCGPLGGIHAALASAPTQKVFVISCDVPFLNQQIVQQLLDADSHADATIVSTNHRAEPLCGIYDARVFPTLEEHLRQGQFSATRFLESVKTVHVSPTDETTHALLNINTPIEYAHYYIYPTGVSQIASEAPH